MIVKLEEGENAQGEVVNTPGVHDRADGARGCEEVDR